MTNRKPLTDARFKVLNVDALSYEERNALADDVRSIVEEDFPTRFAKGAPSDAFPAAEGVLIARIGGQRNLRSYVDTLMVGIAYRARVSR